MFHPASLFIGLRYSRARKGHGFISFINFFSITGVMLGVAALIIVTSVMNGFESELKRRILGIVPQVTIQAEDGSPIKAWPDLIEQSSTIAHVKGATPFIASEGMAQSRKTLRGAMIYGVWPEQETALSTIGNHMISGELGWLKSGEFGVVIGRGMGAKLGVNVGDSIRLMVAEGSVFTPMGRMPSQRRFRVVGMYEVGADIDTFVVLIHGDDAARLTRKPIGSAEGIRLYLDDAFLADQTATKLTSLLPAKWQVDTWSRSQGKLFSAVKMEKNMMWLLLSLIIAVAAFNIVSALVMLVGEKRAEIAILKTLGLTPAGVQTVFLFQGIYNGVVGTLLGLIIGSAIVLNLDVLTPILNLPLVPAPGLGNRSMPVEYQIEQVAMLASVAVALCIAAAFYPAWRASKIQPAEALRYE
ncbi:MULTISPECIES: lipoprotein-releasing ABC transporter permease subunit [Corallincola]|uniref:Lipoprotein-releasing ABC transporter permease subunit n=3 Tax=Corallincola TaxID=1775176 RepID=A0A368NTN9_9GAMM|nr:MULTISPECIES: lipoprotein-releasing ABC transporter permease subunit [Corallincola]RCU52581.1 lipoprotein-releasing ABC transporter permease subunit [Corallincola holothuriorum]TAA48226.1 lipoprotein-releasing ABC transporter permease subunit [Corallincola spongiicola]TCI02479.1 lipoprotein-releasing ABC transporter permease subunit [Corallincola luteus]